jgi:hypothetical protein
MRSLRAAMWAGLAGVMLVVGCGGSGGSTNTKSLVSKEPAIENRWLRGLWANDIRDAVGKIGMTCKGPNIENKSSVWMCESGTPLVSYKLRFYGSAPGKIEYLNAVVEQSGPAKGELPLRLFGVLAGLHFDGADQAKLRTWLQSTIDAGGLTEFGPTKYKLAGDANRRVFDMKASGSEW